MTVLETIVDFLNGIGIETVEGHVPASSFLPGVRTGLPSSVITNPSGPSAHSPSSRSQTSNPHSACRAPITLSGSSPSRSIAARLIRRWPRWAGLKLPPRSPMRLVIRAPR